ncbi:hypothetical protein ACWDBP_07725 [Streptomyces sp. NPDC001233]
MPAGHRFGHAQSAAGAKHVRDIRAGLRGRRPAEGALAEEAEPVRTRHVRAAEAAVHVVSALSEVAGTRSALDSPHPHRPWRGARTRPPPLDETLRAAPFGWHDPARWKVQHLGRYG